MAVAFGIAAAIGFGVADFIGGLQSRRHSVPIVVAISQGTGFTIVAIILLASGQALPPLDAVVLGFLSGVSLLLGVTAYYRGFSIGAMGVCAHYRVRRSALLDASTIPDPTGSPEAARFSTLA